VALLIAKGKKISLPPLVIAGRALNFYNWDIIINYINILSPIYEITKLLKTRGKLSLHNAI